MAKKYSRLSRVEEQKNIRSAIKYIILSIAALLAFFFFGLPAIVKFAAFLSDIRQSGEPVIREDTIPPVLPRFNSFPEATNQIKVEISGTTEPGATVILYLNNSEEEILANNEGVFTYAYLLKKGENTISAIAKDSSGNESQESQVYKVTYDNEPPEIEITNPEDGGEYYGSKQRQVVIEGITEENANIKINDRIVVVESDGSFSFATTLSEGENTFTIISEDVAGNSSEETIKLHFTP